MQHEKNSGYRADPQTAFWGGNDETKCPPFTIMSSLWRSKTEIGPKIKLVFTENPVPFLQCLYVLSYAQTHTFFWHHKLLSLSHSVSLSCKHNWYFVNITVQTWTSFPFSLCFSALSLSLNEHFALHYMLSLSLSHTHTHAYTHTHTHTPTHTHRERERETDKNIKHKSHT